MTKKKVTPVQSVKTQSEMQSSNSTMKKHKTWADLPIWTDPKVAKFMTHYHHVVGEARPVRPNWSMAFRPLMTTRLKDVKVVILGREPSTEDIAVPDGYAFSDSGPLVPLQKAPYQTRVFFEALSYDPATRDLPAFRHFCLRNWAKQGVLLWNSLIFSKVGSPARFVGMGADDITLAILRAVYEENPKAVFVFHAGLPKVYETFEGGASIIRPPSFPAFIGDENGVSSFVQFMLFSKINKRLRENGLSEVDWRVK